MSIISGLFGRRPSIPEILCRTEEGFADLTLGIIGRSKQGDGEWHFHVRARHFNQIVGLEIALGAEWKPWSIELGDGSTLPAYNGVVEFRSTGSESDLFSSVLGKLYGVEEPTKMRSAISFTATSLGENPEQLETRELKIKLFYEPEVQDGYAEVFLNVEFTSGIVELREKDEEYRKPLVRAIAGTT